MKSSLIIILIILVIIGAGAAWYFFVREPSPSTNESVGRQPLPESRLITSEDRESLAIPEGIEGEIRYAYDSEGNIVSYLEITEDVRPADRDGDGLADADEEANNTDPDNPDTDGDGWRDGDEVKYASDPTKKDADADGLADLDEFATYQTDPLKADTDGDGFSDGTEVQGGFNPKGEGRL